MKRLVRRLTWFDRTYRPKSDERIPLVESQQSRFINQLARAMYSPVRVFGFFHEVLVTGVEHLVAVKDKPFVLLAKHQTRIHDELMAGLEVYHSTGKYCKFLITEDLYRNRASKWWLEKLGSFSIQRPSDLRKEIAKLKGLPVAEKSERKRQLQESARAKKVDAQNKLLHYILNEQPICVFPEGKKNFQEVPDINALPGVISNLRFLLELQPKVREMGHDKINFIPVCTEFVKERWRRTKIIFRYGASIQVADHEIHRLATHVVEHVKLFQNEENLATLASLHQQGV